MNKYITLLFFLIFLFLLTNFTTYQNKKKKNYIIKNDEIILLSPNLDAEYSRFNIKTKKCTHLYCLQMVNELLLNKNKYKKVLILGVALGAQIIHLLNSNQNMYITGVDILDDNFDLIRKYVDQDRLKLIKYDAYKYVINSNETYDAIICDISIGANIPKFILTKKFLNKINKMIPKSNNKFLLNSIETKIDTSIFKKSFTNYYIKSNKNDDGNNLYFITKK
jgi:hypothetical protein